MVLVTRSFSKIHGLAGLRVGYGVGDPKTMSLLGSHRLEEGVNTLAAAAAVVAVADADHQALSVQRTADDRQEFLNQVNARMLRAIDSLANFVMVNTGRQAADIIEHFRANRALVGGPFPLFDTYIRVSLGTPADMREFWRIWDLMPIHKMSM